MSPRCVIFSPACHKTTVYRGKAYNSAHGEAMIEEKTGVWLVRIRKAPVIHRYVCQQIANGTLI